MQENGKYAQRTNVAHAEQIGAKERGTKCAPIGELVFYKLSRHKPTKEYAGEETAHGQEYLSCYEVEDVEQRVPGDAQTVHCAQRKRTKRTNCERSCRYDGGRLLTSDVEFFEEEGSAYLVQRDERRECG